ncbi:MAG: hypothetical protein KDC37_03800 [Flavobacteriales bacterium]|nr:hypothetical protein [Flavobacteriales bacterium]
MRTLLLFVAVLFSLTVTGQVRGEQADSSIRFPYISVLYGFQLPGADLAERFGFSHAIGGGFFYKMRKQFTFGISGYYQFGNQVRERDILSSLSSSQGYLINVDGEEATIVLYQRGFSMSAHVGYLLPVLAPNPNSGILFMAGMGFLQHRIRIEDPIGKTPQIEGDYQKGYDRMTNGPALSQFVGYQYFSNNRLLNFTLGVEFSEAFTRNRRSYNFDEQRRDDKSRLDLLSTFRFSWNIPLYKRMAREYFYY